MQGRASSVKSGGQEGRRLKRNGKPGAALALGEITKRPEPEPSFSALNVTRQLQRVPCTLEEDLSGSGSAFSYEWMDRRMD